MSHPRRRRGAALRALRAIPDVRVAVALLFACTLATPRAPLVRHHHAGGDRAHVHVETALVEWLAGAASAPRESAGAGTRARPAFNRADGAAGGHLHQQDRYQAGIAPAGVALAATACVAPLQPRHDGYAPACPPLAASARAPPRSPLA